ncbi:MAG TPA: peptidoglycan-binding protein [Gaiellaceae bacterium]|nr:peptidoglycan-binding protein [Gaiellaceae bacterium]
MATLTAFCLVIPCLAGGAFAAGNPEIAALQVGLRHRGLYRGTVDGVLGPGTESAVIRFQRRAGLPADGVPGRRTRKALGRYGKRAPLGGRPLLLGMRGWDVAALQFALAWHGFPSGNFDGDFGSHTYEALRKFQRREGIAPDGIAGQETVIALRGPIPRSPLSVAHPLIGPVGDTFGPRGNRFHAGVDFPAPKGAVVGAARSGRVAFAGWGGSGYGNLVVIAHGSGVRTLYAHLSRMAVKPGENVAAGSTIGFVGASGRATGPHLHFELTVRGANVDPLSAL